MAMYGRKPSKTRTPLTATKLEELALNYVGRFATSRSKLVTYLRQKLRERGWDGSGEAPVEALADKFVRLGYIDDRAFALSKARSLTGRGYGERRVQQALASSGIGEEDAVDAREYAAEEAVAAALKFAKRKSLGPFAEAVPDRLQRERSLAAMVRAGHSFSLANAIIDLKPGEIPDSADLVNVR